MELDSQDLNGPSSFLAKAVVLEKEYCVLSSKMSTVMDKAVYLKHKEEVSVLKDRCFSFLSQSKEQWKLTEIDRDLAPIEILQSLHSEVEKKLNEWNQLSTACHHESVEIRQQERQFHAAMNGLHLDSGKSQAFEKPIGRGQRLSQTAQTVPSVGGLNYQGPSLNATNNYNFCPQPWFSSVANPLANQPQPMMTNLTGFYAMPANVLITPQGIPVGVMPLPFSNLPKGTSCPSTKDFELVQLDSPDEDADKKVFLPSEDEMRRTPVKNNQDCAEKEPISLQPHTSISTNHNQDSNHINDQNCDPPVDYTSPEISSGAETQYDSGNRRPTAPHVSPVKQPSSNIYSILRHANTPLRTPKERCNPNVDKSKQAPPIPSSSPLKSKAFNPLQQAHAPIPTKKRIITPDEYKMRMIEGGSSGTVKRSQPAKAGVSPSSSASPPKSKSLVNRPNNADKVPVSYEKLMAISQNYADSASKGPAPSGVAAKPLKGILKKPAPPLLPPAPLLPLPRSPPQKPQAPVINPKDQQNQKASSSQAPQVQMKVKSTRPPIRSNQLHSLYYYYQVTNEDKTKCLICKSTYKFITKHYKEKHPTSEVLISRISPADLQQALLEVDIVPPLVGTFQCRLCPTQLDCLSAFKDHITFHTGEYNYCCSECSFTFPEKKMLLPHWSRLHSAQHGPTPTSIELDMFQQPNPPNIIPGYVCPICNWLQLKKERVEKHLENVHGSESLKDHELKAINMVLYIPDDIDTAPAKPKKTRRRKQSIDYNEEKADKVLSKKLKGQKGSFGSLPTSSPSVSSCGSVVPKRNYIEHDGKDDSVPCLICREPYNMTTKTSDWIECIMCLKWLHADCTSFSDTCGLCGKKQNVMRDSLIIPPPSRGLEK